MQWKWKNYLITWKYFFLFYIYMENNKLITFYWFFFFFYNLIFFLFKWKRIANIKHIFVHKLLIHNLC